MKPIKIDKNLKITFQNLHHDVNLKQLFTLDDVVYIVNNSPNIPVDILSLVLNCPYLKDYDEEIKQPIQDKTNCTSLILSLVKDDIMEPINVPLYWSFKGYSKKEKESYAIEFSPIQELKDLPIIIDNKIDGLIIPIDLHTILYEIFWELSFLGSPKERDEKSKGLAAQVKQIEDGTAVLLTKDEVFKNIKTKLGY